MSLELLISKYIDGELSQVEDAKLRAMLKENPFAKEKFEQSVELHMDLIEDRNTITVPADLLKRTEEAVMMKILTAPVIAQKNIVQSNKFKLRIPALAAIIAFLAFVSYLQISETNYPRTIELFQSKKFLNFSENNEKVESQNNPVKNDVSPIQIINKISEKNVVESDIANINPDEIVIKDLIIIQSDDDEVASENNIITEDTINNENVFPSVKMPASTSMMNNNTIANVHGFNNIREITQSNLPVVSFGLNGNEITSIQLTTTMSRDFARTGIETSSNSTILNMSQSIGYMLNGNTSFGLEIGMTELNYDYTKMIPIGGIGEISSTNKGFQINEPGGTGGGSTTINVPVRLQRQEQVIWGMAFYETSLITSGNFSLIGRLGLGGTNDGPLGLGRVLAKYHLLSGISLTAGAEGRMFMMKTPLLNDGISSITSYGFVYGVQFNF
jgi:hypothetical protein